MQFTVRTLGPYFFNKLVKPQPQKLHLWNRWGRWSSEQTSPLVCLWWDSLQATNSQHHLLRQITSTTSSNKGKLSAVVVSSARAWINVHTVLTSNAIALILLVTAVIAERDGLDHWWWVLFYDGRYGICYPGHLPAFILVFQHVVWLWFQTKAWKCDHSHSDSSWCW